MYHMKWIIPDHVVHIKSMGVQTLETIAEQSQDMYSLLEGTSSQRIHFIYDNSEIVQLPSDLMAMKKALKWTNHPKVGWIVSYGGRTSVVMYIVRVLGGYLNIKHSNQFSYVHAMNFLMKKDPMLKNRVSSLVEQSSA